MSCLKFASVSNKTSNAVLSCYRFKRVRLTFGNVDETLAKDVIIQMKPLLALSHNINWFFNNLHKK